MSVNSNLFYCTIVHTPFDYLGQTELETWMLYRRLSTDFKNHENYIDSNTDNNCSLIYMSDILRHTNIKYI